MKVLIAGGAGQVGRALCAATPPGAQVAAPGRDELDIGDADAVRRAIAETQADLVINAAAYTAVDRAEGDPGEAHRINAAAVGDLAAACGASGARLVHFSTDLVFGGAQAKPYRPTDAAAPLNIYGQSKRAGEVAALADPRNLVVRTAWVYGAEGNNFARTMLRQMSERDAVRVVADQVGTPTHAVSLARATWTLIARGASGIHHFTDAGVASWYDFAVAVQEEALGLGLLDRAVPVVPIATGQYPAAARRPPYSVLDKAATWEALGGPARHWRAELRDMLAALAGSRDG
jgi:dTDP-4-dehydrorhamnose reductase